MVWRDTAGHQIEVPILKRKRLGLRIGGSDVGQLALLRFALYEIEHFLGDVGGPYTRDMWRESVGDVTATGRDIEDMPALLRGGESDQPLETFAERVRLAGQITCSGLAKFFLDEALVHDFPDRSWRAAYIACLARVRYAVTYENSEWRLSAGRCRRRSGRHSHDDCCKRPAPSGPLRPGAKRIRLLQWPHTHKWGSPRRRGAPKRRRRTRPKMPAARAKALRRTGSAWPSYRGGLRVCQSAWARK